MKIYLDKFNKEESAVNRYLKSRDNVITSYEYEYEEDFGPTIKLFLCIDTFTEIISIIRLTYVKTMERWYEEEMIFDSDSFKLLCGLIDDDIMSGGVYTDVIKEYYK